MLYDNNPFKLLEVSPTDNRREIVKQAEEKSLLLDPEKCAEARTTLTNPQRRIAAEVHWFLDCNAEQTEEIETFISDERSGNRSNEFSWDSYCPLTQLNIQLACLGAQDFSILAKARYFVLGLSRLFEAVNSDEVLQLINNKRRLAGFPEVSNRQDIDNALGEVRTEIRQGISQKLQDLPEKTYTQMVTSLAESYSGNRRYKGHAVLEDAISEYQIYINDTLQKRGQEIIRTAHFIEQGAERININQAVLDLIEKLYAWDRLAQPLQLGALTKGSSHEESNEMLHALRDLALALHNDYGYTEESLDITRAMQEVFKELPQFSDQLSDDSETLEKVLGEKETEEIVSPLLKVITASFEDVKNCPENQRTAKVHNLIQAIQNANIGIKQAHLDMDTADSLRNTLALLAHSYAVELHNDLNRTEDAMQIVSALEPEFSDLPEAKEKFKEDKEILSKLIQENKSADGILNGLKDVESTGEALKKAVSSNRSGLIHTLISKMIAVDNLIKSGVSDHKTQNDIRERLAYLVRSVGIDLHNVGHDSESAMRVMAAVKSEFSDLPNLLSVLNNDINTLGSQLNMQRTLVARKRMQEDAQKTKRIVGGIIAAIVILIIAANACNSSSSSSRSTSSSSSYSYSSTPRPATTPKPTVKPTPTLTPQTMPANGKVFYCSTTDRPSSFKVTNSGSSNYYMKFVKAGTNTTVITFFVRANSTVEIDMPAGNLELRYACGSTWYGEKNLFGEKTAYAKDEEYYDFSNYTWEISLYTSNNYGQTMDVETIDADEF